MIPINEIIQLVLLAESLFSAPKSGPEKLQYVLAQLNIRYPDMIPDEIEKVIQDLLKSEVILKALRKLKKGCFSCAK